MIIAKRFARAFALSALFLTFGCGKDEPTGAKENLTDKDKQQIEDLNKQRQEEWQKP